MARSMGLQRVDRTVPPMEPKWVGTWVVGYWELPWEIPMGRPRVPHWVDKTALPSEYCWAIRRVSSRGVGRDLPKGDWMEER